MYVNVLVWANVAPAGEVVVYASRPAGDVLFIFSDAWCATMRVAREAHDKGLVFLAQRRVGDRIHYEATRISRSTAAVLGLYVPRGKAA